MASPIFRPEISMLTGSAGPARASRTLLWSSAGLVAASWLSAAIFGLYILTSYVLAIPAGRLDQWNTHLPGLYEKGNWGALVAMGAHLVTGGVILILGPIQLVGGVRRRWPGLHRWLGRVYVSTAAIAGAGGLAFIAIRGTIGGSTMNVGFGIYGALVVLAAFQTYRYARQRKFELHRAWSIRLFALAIGSWLYRIDYGFWLMLTHRLWHTSDFRGPFDVVMAFFFYIPNLLLAELFIRARQMPEHSVVRIAAAALLNLATLVTAVGTYYFARYYWLPAIFKGLTGNFG